jgi:hypothetical protein
MILKVHIAAFELEENSWLLKRGDTVQFWMFFEEAGYDTTLPVERLQEVSGQAHPVAWDGQHAGPYPARLDVGPAALYWGSPGSAIGEVRLVGAIHRDNTDAPPGFPSTIAIVRRIRMEWREYVVSGPRRWRIGDNQARYEDVDTSYLPVDELDAADLARHREAKQELPARRRRTPRHREGTEFLTMPGGSAPAPALGTRKWKWTGVLLDVEATGTAPG